MATYATLSQCHYATISANLMSTKIPNGNMEHYSNTTIIHCTTISANLMSTKIPNGNMEHCSNTTIIHCTTISANLISSIATKWQHAILHNHSPRTQ